MNERSDASAAKAAASAAAARKAWVRLIVREYEGRLLRYSARLLHGNVELARDVVQDTFLRLCRQERSDVEDHIAAWLYTVCRNRTFEVLRKNKRLTSLQAAHLEAQGVDGLSPSMQAEKEDDLSDMQRVIAELPERQQEVLRLRFQNDLSYKDISQVTGLTVTNVGVILHIAVKQIRSQFVIDDDSKSS